MYILIDKETNEILAKSEVEYEGFEFTERDVESGLDGKLYFADEMPDFTELKNKQRAEQIKVEIKDLEAQQDRPLRELELINNSVNPDPLSEFTIEQQKIKALEKLENISRLIANLRKELAELQP